MTAYNSAPSKFGLIEIENACFELATDHLLAANELAPKDDHRFYLNGVQVEIRPDTTYYIGTDGSALWASFGLTIAANPDFRDFSIIIPKDIVSKINKHNDRTMLRCVNGQWSIDNLIFKPVDGHYPDWRRVITVEPCQQPATLDPKYIAKGHKAYQKMYGNKTIPQITYVNNGTAGIMHMGHENSMIMIMGIRADHQPKYVKFKA